jgi:hypothetical protein
MEPVLPEQIFTRTRAIGDGHTPGTSELIAFVMAERCPAPPGALGDARRLYTLADLLSANLREGLAETGRLFDRLAWP